MPFREKTLGPLASRWTLPAFVGVGMVTIAVWVGWALLLSSGSKAGITPGVILLVAGFGGIAMLDVLGIAVTVVLIEASLYESRVVLNRAIQALATASHQLPEEPEP